MKTKLPILLWIVILLHAVWAAYSLLGSSQLFQLDILDKRYPVLLSNEVVVAFLTLSLLGGVLANGAVVVSAIKASKRSLPYAIAGVVFALLGMLAAFEGMAFGRSVPEYIFQSILAIWAGGLLLRGGSIAYLWALKSRGVLV